MCSLESRLVLIQPWTVNLALYHQIQPPILPRPDTGLLGLSYRRTPVLAINRDIILDIRLMISELEARFPEKPRLGAAAAGAALDGGNGSIEARIVEQILERFMVDAGVIGKAISLIPTNLPVFQDEKFLKDRKEFSGRSWDAEDMRNPKPEALVHIREVFCFLEDTLLVDGRVWVSKGERPGLADICGMSQRFFAAFFQISRLTDST